MLDFIYFEFYKLILLSRKIRVSNKRVKIRYLVFWIIINKLLCNFFILHLGWILLINNNKAFTFECFVLKEKEWNHFVLNIS